MGNIVPFTGRTLAAAVALCAGQASWAGERKAPRADTDIARADASAIIIVSATRRASPLATTPVAVTAVTAGSMRDAGVRDVRELQAIVPSLLVYATGSDANSVARIRGVGTVGDNPGLESSVAMFIDGVYRPRIGAALTELGAVERVEVLRGPQGTLFGRNSSAGLVNIVTRAPEFTPGGEGEITHGNFDLWRLSARVTGPLVRDKLAISLEGVATRRDGYLTVADAGGAVIGRTNDRDRWLLRAQVLLRPDDALSIRLIGDYTHRDESCCGAIYLDRGEDVGTSPATAKVAPTNRIVTILDSLAPGGRQASGTGPGGMTATFTPGRLPVSRMRDWGVSAEFDLALPGGTNLTAITAWRDYWSSDAGDQDYAAADLVYRDANTYRDFRTFSQELRAQGKAVGGRLDWLVGAYYAHEDLVLRDDVRFGTDYGRFAACRLLAGAGVPPSPLLAFAPDCTRPAALNALSDQLRGAGVPGSVTDALNRGLVTLGGVTGGGDSDARYRQRSESLALFTHDIVHLTRRVDLTLGLRYTHEIKRFSATFDNDNTACPPLQSGGLPAIATNPALGSAAALAGGILALGCLGNSSPSLNALRLSDRRSDGKLSGTAILAWHPAERLMLYASYARGYKAGGYNLDRFELGNDGLGTHIAPVTFFRPRTDADVSSLRFGAETVDAFELGARIGGRRWSAALTGFRQLFANFQLNTFNGTGFIVQTINGCSGPLTAGTCAAGDVSAGLVSQGVELELAATPVSDLSVQAGLTYADTRFADRLVGSRDGRTPLDPALFLLPGRTMFNAPDIVATASVTWTPPLGSLGVSALFHIDARHVADTNAGADLYPEKAQTAYTLVGARVGLRGPGHRWALEIWAQNLLNTAYSQVIFSTPFQSSGPNNQSAAQLNGTTSMIANQLFSGFPGEPRMYGLTLRWRM